MFDGSCLMFDVAGLYFGQPRGFRHDSNGDLTGYNTMVYSAKEVRFF
jgi:hypothetical protein